MSDVLPRSFYARGTVSVARDLLGKRLVRVWNGARLSGIITETEAYGHGNDPASHACSGRTERNRAMFGPVGRAYVYFTYGMYYCVNAVAYGSNAKAGAVLIRAVMPDENIDAMKRNRNNSDHISDGPAKVTMAMRIGRDEYGADLTKRGQLFIEGGVPVRGIRPSRRIGIRKAVDKRWNFTAGVSAQAFGTQRAPGGRGAVTRHFSPF